MKHEPFIAIDNADVPLTDRLEAGILPLINLVFLLLMFFLFAGVIAQDRLPELPKNDATHRSEEPRVDFTIDADGQLLQNGELIPLAQLAAYLPKRNAKPDETRTEGAGADPAEPIRLGAHQNLHMAQLERILAAFDKAGVPRVQLLTEPSR